MEKLLKLIAFLLIVAVFLPLKAQLSLIPFENGIYKISTPEHLNYLSNAAQNEETLEEHIFHLMNDIDMLDVEFVPIGGYASIYGTSKRYFSGNFNGNNYKIRNLNVKISSIYIYPTVAFLDASSMD